MKIGYSFWGFLGDKKLDKDFNALSTPDGNAFYSWSIIHDLVKSGHEVVKVMPDRDRPGYERYGVELFGSFANEKRVDAYRASSSITYPEDLSGMTAEDVFGLWDESGLLACDLILLEWRMHIKGRNDYESRSMGASWQPDFFLQSCLVRYCIAHQIPLTVFDLDYKLEIWQAQSIASSLKDFRIFELGDRWKSEAPELRSETVGVPFDFDEMYTFKPKVRVDNKLIYVGNRYERDWCVDKYMPKSTAGVVLYGNWLEAGRDSAARWPTVDFRPRVSAADMPKIYQSAATTILLAKKEYCAYHFMTARMLEAAFYGVVPLFIEEYGKDFIEYIAGPLASALTVRCEEDVIKKMDTFYRNAAGRVWTINALREELKPTFDVSNFTAALLGELKPKWARSSRKTAQQYVNENMFRPLEGVDGALFFSNRLY